MARPMWLFLSLVAAYTVTAESQMALGFPRIVTDYARYNGLALKAEFLVKLAECAGDLVEEYYTIDVGALGFVWMPVENRLWEFEHDDYNMTRCIDDVDDELDLDLGVQYFDNDIGQETVNGRSRDSTNWIFFDLDFPGEAESGHEQKANTLFGLFWRKRLCVHPRPCARRLHVDWLDKPRLQMRSKFAIFLHFSAVALHKLDV